MESLIIAVGLYLAYVVIDKFSPTIEGSVDIANGKVDRIKKDQETKNLKADVKNTKARSKIYDEALELDNLVSVKEIKALLAGKLKDTPKEAKK